LSLNNLKIISLLGESSDYSSIWNLQKKLVDEIAKGESPESLIFCEHERVLTAGRRTHDRNILDKSLPLHEIERGGDVTYHGPGQLVIYPLLKLNGDIFTKGLHEYLRFCEQLIINLLQKFELDAGRYGPTGVWVKTKSGETKKIASIGVAVRRWVTYHGIALNISPDLTDFQKIRPCDFEASVMTSLKELGIDLSLSEVEKLVTKELFKLLESGEPLQKLAHP
jgi:lipoyl(octanoyl) transferase